MGKFSEESIRQLSTCDKDLQRLFYQIIKTHDYTILKGERDKAEQTVAYQTGKSELEYPNSKHNKKPSDALDAVPYPIDWTNKQRLCYWAGYVMAMAAAMGIKLRWGGDFNQNLDPEDDGWDMAHFELVRDDD